MEISAEWIRVIRDDELTTADQSGCQHAGVEKDDGFAGSTGHSARADDGTVGKSGTWTKY